MPGTRSGLRALAFALKAEALGEALQSYQKIPIKTYGVTAPVVRRRASEALPYVRALLDSAAAEIADDAAEHVLQCEHSDAGREPAERDSALPRAVCADGERRRDGARRGEPRRAHRAVGAVGADLPVADGQLLRERHRRHERHRAAAPVAARRWRPQDQRFTYFVTPSTTLTGRIGALLDPWSRYANPQAPLPVYLPDEALLIKAEALANQNQLAAAQAALDSVRTDCTGGRGIDDPKACLPPLARSSRRSSCSTEIYVQRRYELFGTGLRWEDARRRNAIVGPVAAPAVPTDGQRCWLPYAVGDRNANPNATFTALPDPTEPSAFPASCPDDLRPANDFYPILMNRSLVGAPLVSRCRRAHRRVRHEGSAAARSQPTGPTGRIRFVNLITDPTRESR